MRTQANTRQMLVKILHTYLTAVANHKLFMTIINNQLTNRMNSYQPVELTSFRKGTLNATEHFNTEHVLTMRTLREKGHESQRISARSTHKFRWHESFQIWQSTWLYITVEQTQNTECQCIIFTGLPHGIWKCKVRKVRQRDAPKLLTALGNISEQSNE